MGSLMRIIGNRRALEFLRMIANEEFDPKKLRYPKSTVYATLSILHKAELVERRDGEYFLTSKGRVWEKALERFDECFEVLSKILESFPSHRISFPDELLLRLFELRKFHVLSFSHSDFFKRSECLSAASTAKKIGCVVPQQLEDFIPLLMKIARDAELEIVHNSGKLACSDSTRVYVLNREPELAMFLSDDLLSITFPLTSGEYDMRFLVSKDADAVRFGRDLFKHYRELSEPR